MERYAKQLCEKYDLVIQEELLGGLNNDGVYRVRNDNSVSLILKIATKPNTIAEIAMNLRGYQALRENSLSCVIPAIFFHELSAQQAMIITEDFGDNFLTQITNTKHPVNFYQNLSSELERIYLLSRQSGCHGREKIISIISLVIEQYEKYLFMHMDKERQIATALHTLQSSIAVDSLSFCCFSDWDFTPEDIYLTEAGLKYSDPHDDILGVPIIDLACFSALVKLYGLPEAETGYEVLKQLALEKVPALLSIDKQLALKLFFLGRLLQRFLSARFRFEAQPEQAHALFAEGKMYLEKITQL